jgi:hypothetical protein
MRSENTDTGWPSGNALETIKVQVTGGAPGLTAPVAFRGRPARHYLPGLPVGAAFRSLTASLAGTNRADSAGLAFLPSSGGRGHRRSRGADHSGRVEGNGPFGDSLACRAWLPSGRAMITKD